MGGELNTVIVDRVLSVKGWFGRGYNSDRLSLRLERRGQVAGAENKSAWHQYPGEHGYAQGHLTPSDQGSSLQPAGVVSKNANLEF